MTPAQLAVWLMALRPVTDASGAPFRRPAGFVSIVASLAAESEDLDPRLLAATLDVVGAHESSYDAAAVGDGGDSCGAWQTPCAETPMPAGWRAEYRPARAAENAARALPSETVDQRAERDDAIARARHALADAHAHRLAHMTSEMRAGQARVAARWIRSSFARCPDHPLSLYATGRICGPVRVADWYVTQIRAEASIPLLESAP